MKSFREFFRPRKQIGTPEGGRFAEKTHAEAQVKLKPVVDLIPSDDDITEDDGTRWSHTTDQGRDRYTSIASGIKVEVSTLPGSGAIRMRVIDGRIPVHLELPGQDFEGDDAVAEAMEKGKQVRESALQYEHNSLEHGGASKWGAIRRHRVLSPGLDEVTTAGHGGVLASPERQEAIDPLWRSPDSWYEQDCAWAIPVITHREGIHPDMLARAHRTARSWYPDEYEAVVGKDPAKFGLDRYEPIALTG